jgi:hypothetical protein
MSASVQHTSAPPTDVLVLVSGDGWAQWNAYHLESEEIIRTKILSVLEQVGDGTLTSEQANVVIENICTLHAWEEHNEVKFYSPADNKCMVAEDTKATPSDHKATLRLNTSTLPPFKTEREWTNELAMDSETFFNFMTAELSPTAQPNPGPTNAFTTTLLQRGEGWQQWNTYSVVPEKYFRQKVYAVVRQFENKTMSADQAKAIIHVLSSCYAWQVTAGEDGEENATRIRFFSPGENACMMAEETKDASHVENEQLAQHMSGLVVFQIPGVWDEILNISDTDEFFAAVWTKLDE